MRKEKHQLINQLPHTIAIAVRITGSDTDSKKEDKDKLIKAAITTIMGAGGTTLIYTRVFRLYGLYTQLKSDFIVDIANWLYPYMTPAKLG